MTASGLAAWWGAGLASLVFAWDIYKWKTSGSRLDLRVSSNMQIAGEGPAVYVFVEVVNRGEKLTTLTRLGSLPLCVEMAALCAKAKGCGDHSAPSGGASLPFELEPGKRWTAMIDQEELVSRSVGGEVFVMVAHSGHRREVTRRIAFDR
jgi:hypothetical protein